MNHAKAYIYMSWCIYLKNLDLPLVMYIEITWFHQDKIRQ
jgi:hypothetical protein